MPRKSNIPTELEPSIIKRWLTGWTAPEIPIARYTRGFTVLPQQPQSWDEACIPLRYLAW